jgi:hypothetical protein
MTSFWMPSEYIRIVSGVLAAMICKTPYGQEIKTARNSGSYSIPA